MNRRSRKMRRIRKMKMDSTQKRRMWKVAFVHFALTVFCIVAPIFISTAVTWSGAHNEAYFQALEHRAWRQAWFDFVCNFRFVSQPQFLLFSKIFEGWVINLLLVTVPIWSICFGWLYVKFTNWLNHFPVLGRKVF